MSWRVFTDGTTHVDGPRDGGRAEVARARIASEKEHGPVRGPWAVSGKEGGRLALELSSSLLSMAAVTDTSAAAMTGRLREAACTGAAGPAVHAASAMCPITSIFGRRTLLPRVLGATARWRWVAVAKSSERGGNRGNPYAWHAFAKPRQHSASRNVSRARRRKSWRHVFARRRAGEAPPGARRELKDRMCLPASAPREDILSSSA